PRAPGWPPSEANADDVQKRTFVGVLEKAGSMAGFELLSPTIVWSSVSDGSRQPEPGSPFVLFWQYVIASSWVCELEGTTCCHTRCVWLSMTVPSDTVNLPEGASAALGRTVAKR